MNVYEDVPKIARREAESAFASKDSVAISRALVSVAFHDPDWRWAQAKCLTFLEDNDPEVSGAAAICLGHIVRIHRTIDATLVTAALRSHLRNPLIAGRVEDALEDIEMFYTKS